MNKGVPEVNTLMAVTSSQRPGFEIKPWVADEVALRQVFLQVHSNPFKTTSVYPTPRL
jgi:hypothetical protein